MRYCRQFFIAFGQPAHKIDIMRVIVVILSILLYTIPVGAQDNPAFSLGIGPGMAALGGGNGPTFTLGMAYRIGFSVYLSQRWRADMVLNGYKLYDDITADSPFQLGSDKEDRTWGRKVYDLSFLARYNLLPPDFAVRLYTGGGGGVSVWKLVDPGSGKTILTSGERNEPLNASATEVILSAGLGIEYATNNHWIFGLDVRTDYLTGAGLEFIDTFEDSLSRWSIKAALTISFAFGGKKKATDWDRHEMEWNKAPTKVSPTPVATTVTKPAIKAPKYSGKDDDGDGIPDDLDACPNTKREARGRVDVYGCPVDSDFDGIPDYLDTCPHNAVGAHIDKNGCPLDSDGDGIPDGIDDCPDSEPGLPVDTYGCIDLAMLEKPVTLHIKYDPGSFEVDRKNRIRLEEIAKILKKAPGVRVEILGYTDNIGLPEDNRSLSQKRANRVRDYLVSLGIESVRLTPIGKGETNFIASNDTRDGRQKNRRVILIFYK